MILTMDLTKKRFRSWIYAATIFIVYFTGKTEGAARFLSHVPHDDYLPETIERELPDYDSDVKIPGRHFPKLPYERPYLENDHDQQHSSHVSHHSSYNNNNHNLHHSTHHSKGHSHHGNKHNNHHQPYDTEPIMAYGVRRDPSGGTFSRESSFNNLRTNYESKDYLDDSRGFASEVRNVHRLGIPSPPPTTPLSPSPSFDRHTPRSLTVQSGKTAKLICKVIDVGDKSVSWMRHEDLHILSVDKYKYSTDQRLSVIFNEADQEWILQIQSVQEDDTGLYECQVSTKPVLSFIVSMNVVESLTSTTPFPKLSDEQAPDEEFYAQEGHNSKVPSASIINGPEIYVHRGSLINLTCVVDHTVERPRYIYWYHSNKMIDYENEGDTVKVDRSGPNTISNLQIKDASFSDSGKYTCRPSNGEDATVMLHVLNGENQAAMQTNTSDRLMTSIATIFGAISIVISALILFCRW